MTQRFIKFPTTPHLLLPDGLSIRGDKIMDAGERAEFLNRSLHIEEKVDGANLGISFDSLLELRMQNRGQYLTSFDGQWTTLPRWIASKRQLLGDVLSDRFILFGEWCYARHTLAYDKLPDWFLAFDVFDKGEQKFLSVTKRDEMIKHMELFSVPQYAQGKFQLKDLRKFLIESKLAQSLPEGIYLRADSVDWLLKRAKLVRPEFVQSHREHWSHSQIVRNKLLEHAS